MTKLISKEIMAEFDLPEPSRGNRYPNSWKKFEKNTNNRLAASECLAKLTR